MPIISTWIKNKETLLVLQTLLNLRTLQNPLTQHLDKASSSTTLSRNPTTVTPLRSNYVSLATRADRSKSFGALQALQTETSGDSRFKSSLATFTRAHKRAQKSHRSTVTRTRLGLTTPISDATSIPKPPKMLQLLILIHVEKYIHQL